MDLDPRLITSSALPPLTTSYHLDHNTLHLPSLYHSLKPLLIHPLCLHRRDTCTWPCISCSTIFLDLFWQAAASLLDYFADFHALDTPHMHSVWFHILDMWQESATWLPVRAVLDTGEALAPREVWGYADAMQFQRDIQDTVKLVEAAIHGVEYAKHTERWSSGIVHHPTGVKDSPVGEYRYETGPWVSGLTAWEQWLGEGSPGAAPRDTRRAPAKDTAEDTETRVHGETEKDKDKQTRTRCLPMPLIALLATHTHRARALAHRFYTATDPSAAPEQLRVFDAASLRFPRAPGEHVSLASELSGQVYSYAVVNGAPPVARCEGFVDPEMRAEKPGSNLLDECVGMCRGFEAYVPVTGGAGAQDDGEDGSSEEDEEEGFDMWVLREGVGQGVGWRMGGFGDMFDEWVGDEEF
ncbi:hypothetical protein ACN47E_000505 [Coniothyrium glycines]